MADRVQGRAHSLPKEERRADTSRWLHPNRVVVPPAGREAIMELLHNGHPGISRMKSIARSYVWWPNMDKQLEEKVKKCNTCQMTRHSTPPTPMHPWEWPKRPWTRIHVDYAGPFLSKMFLIVVDAHSKWMEVAIVNSASSTATIEKLRGMFATHGLPETLVSDNGTAFTSNEFQEFLKCNAIQHVRSAPYHPASNGQAEWAVQTFKNGMKRSTSNSLETRVSRFLFHYRTTPNTITGHSPAELMMGRQLRSHLTLVWPDVAARVTANQHRQKEYHDRSAREKHFQDSDPVYVCDFPTGNSWLPGRVKEVQGQSSVLVELNDGRIVRRHVDHTRSRVESVPASDESVPASDEDDGWEMVEVSSDSAHQEDRVPEQLPLRQSTRTRTQRTFFDPSSY